MKQTPSRAIVIDDLTGGRNDTDPPLSLPANQATEMLNVDWLDTNFAHKRYGSTALSVSGGTAMGSVRLMERHVPGADETAAELHVIDNSLVWHRLAGGTTWADMTVADAVASASAAFKAVGAPLNGKRFYAYDSSVDRLHVWDGTSVRRAGIQGTSTAPTVANTGAGTYAAVLRYYRVRFLHIASSAIVRRSEASNSVAFTPSGTGTHARITRPTAPGEGETHWEVEVSSDNAAWFLLAGHGTGIAGSNTEIVIATTTYDDNAVAADYDNGDISDVLGTYLLFPSVKVLMSDGNRLLGGGAYESSGLYSGGKNSRVWFTPVLGSADTGDDERVPVTTTQKNYVDLNENDGGGITGCGGPLNGLIYWFKYRQVWKLIPTGDVSTPYIPRKIRDDIGCIGHRTITIGEDQHGRPALYFLSHRGPYRITMDGDVEYLGRDNEVTWRAMDLSEDRNGHALYYPQKHQWWLWLYTTGGIRMVFDVQKGFPDQNGQIRGGWIKHSSTVTHNAGGVTLFSNTVGATMSRDLKPYVGTESIVGGQTSPIQKMDVSSATDDDGFDYQATVTTRPILTTRDIQHKVGLGESIITGKALAGSDVSFIINRDFGLETRTHSVSLAPSASETRVFKKVEGSEMGEANAIQITIGDSSANDEQWTVDAIVCPLDVQEVR